MQFKSTNELVYGGVMDVEINAPSDEEGIIYGYASWYGNLDRNGNIIQRGALKGKKLKVPLLWNHDDGDVVGSAEVTEDEKGMRYRAKLAIDSRSQTLRERAEYVYALVKEGHVAGNSIGFIPTKYEYRSKKQGGEEIYYRHIESLDLVEVTICPIQANPRAKVEKHSFNPDAVADLIQPLQREIELLKNQLEELKGDKSSIPADLEAEIRRRMRLF